MPFSPLLVLFRLVQMALELVRHAIGDLGFGLFDGGLEGVDGYPLRRGRVQAEGEEWLLGAGAFAHRVDFIKGGMPVIGHEHAQLMHFDVFVLGGFEQMGGELPTASALAAF